MHEAILDELTTKFRELRYSVPMHDYNVNVGGIIEYHMLCAIIL